MPCSLFAVGIAFGVLGALPASWPLCGASCKTVLFAALLCGLVLARFGWWVQHGPLDGTREVRRFSRELSRMVYLILYLVLGTRQIIELGGRRLQEQRHMAEWQSYLVCGLVALALIRVLAIAHSHRECRRIGPADV